MKRRLMTRLGLSPSVRRRRWWELNPKDKEPILSWHQRAREAAERYLRGFKNRERCYRPFSNGELPQRPSSISSHLGEGSV